MRTVGVILVLLVACLYLSLAPTANAARPFPETGYSITNDRMQDFFDRRGGVRVLGYPISRELYFLGTRVQLFQRAVLQLQPNGSVGLLNILSDDLLPYTRINGSTFPAADQALIQAAPLPSESDYATRAIDFVRAMAPDSWNGLRTNFYSTFAGTVSYQEAFPGGGVDPGLLPLINLEIWGLPTSKPAYDPNNHGFVYLRFQRGIMHFDRATGLTQGILLGDHLKSVITGQNLPGDLAQQAQSGRLYRQYDNSQPGGLSRPWELPGTNLFGAFERDGVFVPTPLPAGPAPISTPIPAASTATPVPQPPAQIQLSGPAQFTNVITWALDLLASHSPSNYLLVRENVHRIGLLESGKAYTDPAGRAINFDHDAYLVSEWYGHQDQQTQWVAGVIVHNAVHIAQHHRGAATTGPEAEMEALRRQEEVLLAVDTTTDPSHQFVNFIYRAINNNTGWFDHFNTPPGPQNPF